MLGALYCQGSCAKARLALKRSYVNDSSALSRSRFHASLHSLLDKLQLELSQGDRQVKKKPPRAVAVSCIGGGGPGGHLDILGGDILLSKGDLVGSPPVSAGKCQLFDMLPSFSQFVEAWLSNSSSRGD